MVHVVAEVVGMGFDDGDKFSAVAQERGNWEVLN